MRATDPQGKATRPLSASIRCSPGRNGFDSMTGLRTAPGGPITSNKIELNITGTTEATVGRISAQTIAGLYKSSSQQAIEHPLAQVGVPNTLDSRGFDLV